MSKTHWFAQVAGSVMASTEPNAPSGVCSSKERLSLVSVLITDDTERSHISKNCKYLWRTRGVGVATIKGPNTLKLGWLSMVWYNVATVHMSVQGEGLSFWIYHLSATILKSLGVEGEGTAQLLGREVHLDFPVISLHHHLLEVALRVRIVISHLLWG